ncbi:sodium/solute symporter [bacterium]|nr:sodium/solute symporter [bacterium]
MNHLVALDWVLVIVYFGVVFGVAWAATRGGLTRRSSTGYFLAGRNVGWFVIGASLFASNIGSEHLVGLAGSGAAGGVAVGQFEILASLILLLLGWLFVPFYLRSGVSTMPEFLERRYSPAARWYLAVISIIGYVLTKISVTVAAGGIVFQALMGLDFWVGALLVVTATGIYTVMGGLRAVLYTDVLQAVVLLVGASAVTVIGLRELGGWGQMTAMAGPGFMDIWPPRDHPDFPWTGILLGAPILGVWYWCTDQFIVQRVLSARDLDQARGGTIFAGFLKLLPLFVFVIPGVIAYGLAQSGRIELESPDQALPVLVGTLLPTGLRGLVVAGLLAALMSSLSSVFNSCSTLVTLDIYKKLRPGTSERRLVLIGQIATVVLVALALLWVPFMKRISDQLFQYLQSVQAYISPPIASVFLVGLFWPWVNARGAMISLLSGFALGTVRLVAELNLAQLTPGGFLHWLATVNFLHFAALLFVVCTVLLVVFSLGGKAPDHGKLAGLTFATSGDRRVPSARRSLHLVVSGVLVVCVAAIWWWFRG